MTESKSFHRKELLQPSELQGIFVPVVMPFKRIGSQIIVDLFSHVKQIKRLAAPSSGVSGIFLGSNAGQGRDMDLSNLKITILTGIEVARSVNEELPVVVGALRKNITEVLEVTKFAEESGADAIVLAPGFTEGDLNETLKVVSENTKLPIILYNNPRFQGKKDLPLEFLEVAKNNPQVIGIKDTSGKPDYFEEVLRIFGSTGKKVMQGDTKAGLQESIYKADGMVPVEANLYAEDFAFLLNRSHAFNPSKLQEIMDSIKRNKAEFGGSTEYIKHILVEEGIFVTDLAYPKID